MRLSAVERNILNMLQREIPLSSRPFRIMAEKAGTTEKKLLEKIREFRRRKIIRHFSAGLNHRRLGFKSTLLGMKVPKNRLKVVAGYLVKCNEVTHCYLRKGEFNLWAVFIYRRNDFRGILDRISGLIGKNNIMNLTTEKQFKLKTFLRLGQ